ncbi:MAG: LysR family transcriptional regulator [Thalassobaculaceae bacterium]
MNIDHLHTFLEVVATGSFHRAADNLNVTQSTVSARIPAADRPARSTSRMRMSASLRLSHHAAAVGSCLLQDAGRCARVPAVDTLAATR